MTINNPTHGALNGGSDSADVGLIRDTARWHELEAEITPLLAVKKERRLKLPEEFRESSIDPRGWQIYEKDCSPAMIDRLKEYERHWIRLGLGEIEDKLNSLWDEQDTYLAAILDASPTTAPGAVAIAAVCLERLGDNPDSFLHETGNVARRALADAQRMLGCAV